MVRRAITLTTLLCAHPLPCILVVPAAAVLVNARGDFSPRRAKVGQGRVSPLPGLANESSREHLYVHYRISKRQNQDV